MNRIPAIILKAVVVTAAVLAPSNLYGQADMEIEETDGGSGPMEVTGTVEGDEGRPGGGAPGNNPYS